MTPHTRAQASKSRAFDTINEALELMKVEIGIIADSTDPLTAREIKREYLGNNFFGDNFYRKVQHALDVELINQLEETDVETGAAA